MSLKYEPASEPLVRLRLEEEEENEYMREPTPKLYPLTANPIH